MFNYLLPIGLEAGIGILEFWDLTLGEINLIIKTDQKKRKDEVESKFLFVYEQAKLITHFVGLSLEGKQIPKFNEVYNLDADTQKDLDYQKAMDYKARMLKWAEGRHNQLLRNKE